MKTKRTRRKRQKWQVGDYFLIMLKDGEFSIGQAIAEISKIYSVVCVLFNIKIKEDGLEKIKDLTINDIISIMVVTKDALDWGNWSVVCNDIPCSVEQYVNINKLTSNTLGLETSTPGIAIDFLDAFYGLAPWDMYYEPDHFDKLLVSPDKKPKKLLYKKDFEKKGQEIN